MSIFGKAKRGFGMLSKSYKPKYIGKVKWGKKSKLKKKGKEWDILEKNPHLSKQKYSDSAVNKYLTKEFKKKK